MGEARFWLRMVNVTKCHRPGSITICELETDSLSLRCHIGAFENYMIDCLGFYAKFDTPLFLWPPLTIPKNVLCLITMWRQHGMKLLLGFLRTCANFFKSDC